MDMIAFLSVILHLLFDIKACTVIYKMTALPDCEMNFAPTIPPISSRDITYGNECLINCRNNNNCNGISICPKAGNPELFTCNLFGSATNGTCANLTSAAGCRYMEFELVPDGLKCVPPRIFDEGRGECRCDPLWMHGPNCDKYYIDCTHAFYDGLRVPGDFLTMPIQPLISSEPFLVKCNLAYGGYIYIQERYATCADNLAGLGWDDFKNGFGEFDCSFFLGLEKIHQITQNGEFFLNAKVETIIIDGNSKYDGFTIGNASTNYTLDYQSFSSQSTHQGDGFNHGGASFVAKGSRFATHDNDFNGCAQTQGTGWWYNEDCAYVNLNMPLNTPPPAGSAGYAAWPRLSDPALKRVTRFFLFIRRTVPT